jgi:hypothetical protein
MTHDEAKIILLRYRPGTTDREEPELRQALALAQVDEELSRWLADNGTRQQLLRTTFKQIQPPEGLLQQIISEHAASQRASANRRRFAQISLVAALVLLGIIGSTFWLGSRPQADNTLAIFKQQMVGYALRGYTMDLQTNDAEQIRAFLRQQQAPADYALSGALQKATLLGCAVEGWQSSKVSMICLGTGPPAAADGKNDLWLFVVDQTSVADAPKGSRPHFDRVNRLATATWSEQGKLYLLATTADEGTLRNFF